MKKVLRWIILIWSIIAIPYIPDTGDFTTGFFSLLYMGLIIGVMIHDLREKKGGE